jgi:hypothetical protein
VVPQKAHGHCTTISWLKFCVREISFGESPSCRRSTLLTYPPGLKKRKKKKSWMQWLEPIIPSSDFPDRMGWGRVRRREVMRERESPGLRAY